MTVAGTGALLGAAGSAAGLAEPKPPLKRYAAAHVCEGGVLLMRLVRFQSQARSATKDAGEAPAEAQEVADTERLRNQFNFNDRTTQVGATQCVAAPQHRCSRSFSDNRHSSAVDRTVIAGSSMARMVTYRKGVLTSYRDCAHCKSIHWVCRQLNFRQGRLLQ